ISSFAYWVQGFFRHTRYITLVNLLADRDPLCEGQRATAKVSNTEPSGVHHRCDPAPSGLPAPASLSAQAAAALGNRILFPEYLTAKDRSGAIAYHIIQWLTRDAVRKDAEQRLATLRDMVGHGGASRRAAQYILATLAARPRVVPQPHYRPATVTVESPTMGEAA